MAVSVNSVKLNSVKMGAPLVAPTGTFTIIPGSIVANGLSTTTFTWTSSNATSAVGTQFSGPDSDNDWPGTKSLSGNQIIGEVILLTGLYVYAITFTGPGGSVTYYANLTRT
jgi:hypothetical protein